MTESRQNGDDAPLHDEAARLLALRETLVMDTASEQVFDDLTQLASRICGTPIALLSLVDAERQWFKSKVGLAVNQTPRELAFCAHAIQAPDKLMEVPEADPRFASNPLVTGEPRIAFYAGVPVLSSEGFALGTLCVIDRQSRSLSPEQRDSLQALARTAGELLRARRQRAQLLQTCDQLQESDARFRRMAQDAPVKMWMSDASGARVFNNQRWCEYVGPGQGSQLGDAWLKAVHPADADHARNEARAAHEKGVLYRSSYRLRNAQGLYRWHLDSGSPRFDEGGEYLGHVGSVTDVHDQSLAAEDLEWRVQLRTAELTALLQCMPDAVISVDMQGRVLVCNARAVEITGRHADEVPPASEQWSDFYGMLGTDGKPLDASEIPLVRALTGEVVASHEMRIRNQVNGEIVIVEARARPLTNDAGQPVGAVVVFADITARKAASAAAEQTRARLAAVFEQSPFFNGLLSVEGVLIEANDFAFQATGWRREDGMDKPFWEGPWWRRSGDMQARIRAAVTQAAAGESFSDSCSYFAKTDAGIVERRLDFLASPVFDAGGEVINIYITGQDATERESARLALEESQGRYRTLMSNSPGIVFRSDIADGWSMQFMSDAVERVTGYPSSHFTEDGVSWGSIMHPDDFDRVSAELATQMSSANASSVEYRVIHRNGSCVEIEGRAKVVDQRWYEGVLIDVTERNRAAAQANASQARFQSVFHQSPMFNGLLSTDGLLLDCNDVGCEPCGWLKADCIDRPFWESPWWSGDVEAARFARRAVLEAAAGHNFSESCDYFVCGTAGLKRRRANFLASPVRDSTGEVINIYVAALDVTREEKIKLDLERSEARFRMMTDTVPLMMWSADANGDIEFANRGGVEYFGLGNADLRGQAWYDAVHPDDVERVKGVWQKSLEDGSPVDTQFRLRRHDGEYRWHIVRGVAHLGADGRPICWYGTNTEIEDLRRAQAAAEAAAESKSQFLANMSHEIRTPMNGVIGMTSLLSSTPLNEEQREFVSTIRSSGEHLLAVINDILDFSKADAGKMQLESYSFPVRTCVEEAMELLASSASAKQIELILDADPDLPEQVIGDAGRLRQVLVNLLSNAIKFSERGDVVVTVRAVARANGSDRWRLNFAIKDSGVGIPADRMDRLFEVFSQVDDSHTRVYGGSGLGLAICKKLVDAMDGRIWVNSEIGSGSTFQFEVDLEHSAHKNRSEPRSLGSKRILVVDDNPTNRRVLCLMLEGWGMQVTLAEGPSEAMNKARNQTFDAALLDYQMPQMTGVSLAHALRSLPACKTLPLLLLGSITGSAAKRNADLFYARMLKPVRQSTLFDQLASLFSDQPERRVRSRPKLGNIAQRYPMRVLIAEDNVVNQKVCVRLLAQLGYEAELASNGAEVLQALHRAPVDLVLMDVQMPVMDGFEATGLIRERYQPGPWIIAVTANALPGDEQRCIDAGMNDYIGKPILPMQLEAVVLRAGMEIEAKNRKMSVEEAAEMSEDYHAKMFDELAALYEKDGAIELIMSMYTDFPRQCEMLEEAVNASDAKSASRVMHSLKSVVRTVNAESLAICLQDAESAFLKADFVAAKAQADVCMERCRHLFERLKSDISSC